MSLFPITNTNFLFFFFPGNSLRKSLKHYKLIRVSETTTLFLIYVDKLLFLRNFFVKSQTPTIKHFENENSASATTSCWVNINISVVSSLTSCVIICISTFGCSRASLQMDFLTLWSVASLSRAAACCVVRSVGADRAPPQAVYVNHVIMLFRSIDRPARRALPVWGQEPWGWRVTFAQHGGAGRPFGPGRRPLVAAGWVASSSRLRPHAEPQSSGLFPSPARQTEADWQRVPNPPTAFRHHSPPRLLLSDAQISVRLILQTPPRQRAD